MDRPKLEVADIFRRYGEAYRQQHGASLSTAQRRVMTAIEVCRTAALGGHLERCDCCHYERPCYSSCRDRHCPKCQSLARAEWVEKRTAEVLQTHYFHVVFSVPEQIASIAYQNKEVLYGILFRAPAEDYRDRYERLTGRSLRECPVCHRGRMITVTTLAEVRSSPAIKDTS